MGDKLFYTVMKVKGRHYLYKVTYVGKGGKKYEYVGPCEVIEQVMKDLKTSNLNDSRARRLAWLGRRPDAAGRRVDPDPGSYNPVLQEVLKDLVITDGVIESFMEWCVGQGNAVHTCRDRANYLRRPLDIGNGHSVRAYRLLLKFLGREPPKELKVPRSGIDLKVPSDEEVFESLRKACEYSEDYCLIYRLLVESGARLTEVVEVLNDYDPSRDVRRGNFYTYVLGRESGTKKSFYVFHTTPLRKVSMSEDHASKLARELGLVRPKHVRKWVATKMASLGIPTEIIDFIQGRTPRTILSKHYLNLYALAQQHYPKYAEKLKP